MSEEEYEEVEQLSAEEIFEQHQAEIAERFEEKGFFKRLGILFKGIGKPHNTREYKLAMTELQRLQAPILAILLPTIGVIVLIVLTAVSAKSKESVQYEVMRAQESEEALQEEVESEPEEIDMTQDIDVTVEVAVDVPNVTTEVMSQSDSPGGEPDTVMAAPSPVTMANIKGSPKLRGLGDGNGGGFGTQIKAGKAQDLEGALIGVIIDMKTQADPENPKGRDIGYNGQGDFMDRLKKCNAGNFTAKACEHVRMLPKRVAMSHLFIPPQSANNGPAAFGVADLMAPKGWLAYYSGDIVPSDKARYRFWGYFDDFMMIRINGKVVWEYTWPCGNLHGAGRCTGWKPDAETAKLLGRYKSPQKNGWLAPGDWWEAKPGQKLKIEIACGEIPGGGTGGIICIEKEGEKYPMHKGQPVFPIFSTRKLSYKEIERFENFCSGKAGNYDRVWPDGFTYMIGTENVPLFNSRKAGGGAKGGGRKRENKKQVDVDVEI